MTVQQTILLALPLRLLRTQSVMLLLHMRTAAPSQTSKSYHRTVISHRGTPRHPLTRLQWSSGRRVPMPFLQPTLDSRAPHASTHTISTRPRTSNSMALQWVRTTAQRTPIQASPKMTGMFLAVSGLTSGKCKTTTEFKISCKVLLATLTSFQILPQLVRTTKSSLGTDQLSDGHSPAKLMAFPVQTPWPRL